MRHSPTHLSRERHLTMPQFDELGPSKAVLMGGCLATLGYVLIGTPVLFTSMPPTLKILFAAVGSLCAGYARCAGHST